MKIFVNCITCTNFFISYDGSLIPTNNVSSNQKEGKDKLTTTDGFKFKNLEKEQQASDESENKTERNLSVLWGCKYCKEMQLIGNCKR